LKLKPPADLTAPLAPEPPGIEWGGWGGRGEGEGGREGGGGMAREGGVEREGRRLRVVTGRGWDNEREERGVCGC